MIHVSYPVQETNYYTDYFCPRCNQDITGSGGDHCRHCGWISERAKGWREETAAKKRATQLGRDLWKQHGHCWYCGVTEELATRPGVDHIIPWHHGGDNALDNLVPCCGKCNTTKSTSDMEAFRERVRRKLYDVVTPEFFWWMQSLGVELPMYEKSPRVVFWFEDNGRGWTW